jgi:hypothetical protein
MHVIRSVFLSRLIQAVFFFRFMKQKAGLEYSRITSEHYIRYV